MAIVGVRQPWIDVSYPGKTSHNRVSNHKALSRDEDLLQTQNLVHLLDSFGVYEGRDSLHRVEIVNKMQMLFREWISEMSEQMCLSDNIKANAGGKVLPYGSYPLGAHTKDSDLDIVCVGPQFIARKDFFSSFYKKLQAHKELKYLQSVEGAFIPMLKFICDGVEVSLVYTRLTQQTVPEDIDLLDNNILKGMDPVCSRSLSGYRSTEMFLRIVPCLSTFRLAAKAIKLWAKRRNIYSHGLGFLGGVSWIIMVAKICQMYPDASAPTVVSNFFKVYNDWSWPDPVTLQGTVDPGFGASVWNSSKTHRPDIMPVITPAYPHQNSTFNVTPSTFTMIMEEIERGFTITKRILQNKEEWSRLFKTSDFVDQYSHFFVVELTSSVEESRSKWVSLCASKVQHLVRFIEMNWQISQARVNTGSFPSHTGDDKNTSRWLIGLSPSMKKFNYKEIHLDSEFQSFRTHVFKCAEQSKMSAEGLRLSGEYVRKEDLTRKPEGPKDCVFGTVRHGVPRSDIPQGTKRHFSTPAQTPSKSWRYNNKPSQRTWTQSSPAAVFSEGKGVSCQSLKRPRITEPETNKRRKLDLNAPPCPSQTVEDQCDQSLRLSRPVFTAQPRFKLKRCHFSHAAN